MKNNQLISLLGLFSSLNMAEKVYFRKITLSSFPEGKDKSRTLEVFDSLENGAPCLNNRRVSDRDRKQISLVGEKVLDSLLLDVSLARVSTNCSGNKLISLHKRLLKARVMDDRGQREEAHRIVELCLFDAQKYEDYYLAAECARFQMRILCINDNLSKYTKAKHYAQLNEYNGSLKSKAVQAYQQFEFKKFRGITENLDIFIVDTLKSLRDIHNKLSSDLSEFFVLFFEYHYLVLKKKFHEALTFINKLIEMANALISCDLVASSSRLKFYKAELLESIGNVKEANFLYLQIVQSSNKQDLLYLWSCYRTLDIDVDLNLKLKWITSIFGNVDLLNNYPKIGFKLYLKSIKFYYLERKYTCLAELFVDMEHLLRKDKEMYFLQRVIFIYCNLKLGYFDQVERQCMSLRKYFDRNKSAFKEFECNRRIVKLLLNLVRNGFVDFEKYLSPIVFTLIERDKTET